MAKCTLGILDGGGWGVGGVTTVCGHHCIAIACYVHQWINTTLRAESNYSRYPKSRADLKGPAV